MCKYMFISVVGSRRAGGREREGGVLEPDQRESSVKHTHIRNIKD